MMLIAFSASRDVFCKIPIVAWTIIIAQTRLGQRIECPSR